MAASMNPQREKKQTNPTEQERQASAKEDTEPSSLEEEILNEQKNVTFSSLVGQCLVILRHNNYT